MDFATDILVKIIAALVLCAIFFRLVMRGRWIAWSHPICSACGHNLTGLPESSANCPECGGELAKVRKNSVWRRRWISLGIATVVTLVCLFIAVGVGLQFISSAPTFALMPFRSNPQVRQILSRRLLTGQLSAMQQTMILGDVLKSPTWQDAQLMEDLHARGKLTDASWRKYAAWAANFPVTVRGQIGRGDPLVIQVGLPPIRWVANSSLEVKHRLRVQLDGKLIMADQSWAADDLQSRLIPLPEDLQASLKEGSHLLDVEVEGRASENKKPDVILARTLSKQAIPIAVLPSGKRSVELVPPETDSMKPSQPEGRSLIIDEWPNFEGNIEKWFPGQSGRYFGYDLVVMEKGKTTIIGQLAMGPREEDWRPNPNCTLHRGYYDVIFRPSAEAATHTIGARQIIDWQFTVHHVRVVK